MRASRPVVTSVLALAAAVTVSITAFSGSSSPGEPGYRVACPTVGATSDGAADIVRTKQQRDDERATPIPALLENSVLYFETPDPQGWAIVQVEGRAPERVEWQTDTFGTRCETPVELHKRAPVVHGFIHNYAAAPPGSVTLTGSCPDSVIQPDGSFVLRPDMPTWTDHASCRLQVVRHESGSALKAYGSTVSLTLERDQGDYEVELTAPDFRPAGLGFALGFAFHPQNPDDDARRLHPVMTEVFTGLPAAQAGIRSGDVVLKVDGEPTADLSERQFLSKTIGRPGTEVVLTVRTGAEPSRTVRMTRRPFTWEETGHPEWRPYQGP